MTGFQWSPTSWKPFCIHITLSEAETNCAVKMIQNPIKRERKEHIITHVFFINVSTVQHLMLLLPNLQKASYICTLFLVCWTLYLAFNHCLFCCEHISFCWTWPALCRSGYDFVGSGRSEVCWLWHSGWPWILRYSLIIRVNRRSNKGFKVGRERKERCWCWIEGSVWKGKRRVVVYTDVT